MLYEHASNITDLLFILKSRCIGLDLDSPLSAKNDVIRIETDKIQSHLPPLGDVRQKYTSCVR